MASRASDSHYDSRDRGSGDRRTSSSAAAAARLEVNKLALVPPIVYSFRVAKEFNIGHITSISFDPTGKQCAVTTTSNDIVIIDCNQGGPRKTIPSKKYGCGLVRFTHHREAVIYASTAKGESHDIRYLSTKDQTFLRYFRGHTDRVTALDMCPSEDKFISASEDRTVRLWSLASDKCLAVLNPPNLAGVQQRKHRAPVVAFDPEGLIFAVSYDSANVILYNFQEIDKAPFMRIAVSTYFHPYLPTGLPDLPEFTRILFINSRTQLGKYILITTSADYMLLIDAFTGDLKLVLCGFYNPPDSKGEHVTATPDGQFLFAGLGDGSVALWTLSTIMNDEGDLIPNSVVLDDFERYVTDLEANHLDASPVHAAEQKRQANNASWPRIMYPTTILNTQHVDGVMALGFNPKYMMMVSGANDIGLWEPASHSGK
ncbi:WD40 repeat-like protein [Ramicandelaber brevisporus]|nr:WD40 repeat-like protein [Ramicandelaber brevisporus]